MKNKINTEIQQLKQSPLFALSLGAKELSHSNFWAWLINIKVNNKNPFIEVFDTNFYKNGYKFEKVLREKGKRDLTIYYLYENQTKALFIENKLKSIPTKEQLNKYIDNFKDKKCEFGGGILTGIEKIIENQYWKFLSYQDIAVRMENIVNKLEKLKALKEYEVKIIKNYILDIKAISKIIKESVKETNGKYTFNIKSSYLSEIKLDDIVLKYIGNKLSLHIKKEIGKEYASSWGMPEIECTFHNKNATIDIFYKEKRNNEYLGSIGVQIEGKEFRLHCAPRSSQSIYANPQELFSKMKEVGYLEEYNQEKKIRNKETSLTIKYRSFNIRDTQTTHIYQYWNLSDNINYEDLIEFIKEELNRAKHIIDSGFTYA